MAHAEQVEEYEHALEQAAARQRQFEEEQEILSDKLIALANEASEWPARQEQLEAEIAVGQGQIKALSSQLTECEERLQHHAAQDQVLAMRESELAEARQQVRCQFVALLLRFSVIIN